MTVRLKGEFRIVISGKVIDVIKRENASRQIGHYLTELLTGTVIPDEVWRPWGLTIEVVPSKED